MDAQAQETLPENLQAIEETFKGLRWTRVIALRDYKDASTNTYAMIEDIQEGHEQMAAIKLEGLPKLIAHFDPVKW